MVNLNALLAEGQDEQVTVNQRALVEKILARYSGEHTVFRELLQNSDDAGATSVELHFRTTSGAAGLDDSQPTYSPESLPNLLATKCATLMVRNDGFVFRQEDWQRLTEIASGNPDEQKIGAFGVGFYSLFSMTDGPVVSSGQRIIQFYWRGDQLHVKSATDESGLKNTSADGKPWTTFLMDLREPAPMPEPNDFARFLTSCLGFTQNLRSLSLFFDGHLLFRVQKTLAPSRNLSLRHNLQSSSPQKLLRMTGVEEAPFQLKAEVSNWMLRYTAKPKPTVASITSAAASSTTSFASKMLAAFSSRSTPSHQPSPVPTPPPRPAPAAKDPFEYVRVMLFLRTVAASLSVSPSPHFANEMLRATKKALPSITKYSLVWTGKDEYDASHGGKTGVGTDHEDEASARKVFSGLLPADISTVQGRVAIGFATHQTSGFAGSVGARFISTVERESLDFQSKYVAQWNQELLWAGGVLARTVFEEEMAEIGRIWKRAGKELEKEKREDLEQRTLHLIRFFTFYKSTPQEIVGGTQEESFFASNTGTSITLLSTVGPTPAHKLRLPSPHLSGFIKSTPVVPPLVADGVPRFLSVLRDKGFIRDISLEDIFADLSSHSLTVSEAVECFKWWTSLASNPSYDPRLLTRLKDVSMLSVPDSSSPDGTRILPIGAFKTYVNPKVVPVDMHLPEHTLPFELSRQLSHSDLSRVFGWKELSLLDWLNYLTSPSMTGKSASVDTNFLASPPFAEKVLAVLAKGWQQVPAVAQRNIIELTSKLAFVPTRNGLKQPNESYFPNVSLFEDLAVVTLPSGAPVKGNMERLLAALGVRRHVELQLVFTRLLGAGDWSHIQLIRYLISVRNTLTPAEQDRLRKTAFLPREGEAKVEQPPGPDGVKPKPKTIRYRASELYEPTDALRELGLPLVDWTEAQARWRSTSDEAKFLYDLGLQRVPTVATVLEIAANSSDPARQEKALRYFLDGCVTHSYSMSYSLSKYALPFVPALAKDQEIRVKPTEVYSNPAAALLGFPVLAPRFAAEETRFGLRRDPPPKELVSAIVSNPPSTIAEASKIFAYLSSQVSTFASADLDALRWASIVPVRKPDGKVENVPPLNLYFSTSDTSLPSGVRSLFATIPDFGPAARPFLVACGVKESPTTPEIATMLIADPARFYDLAGSSDRYLSVLRLVALNYSSLSSSLRSRMKLSAFFLGTKRIAANGSNAGKGQTLLDQDDDEDEEGSDTTLVYQLARASDLAVNDEPAAFHVFQGDILACPQEDALESLAEQLGARRISGLMTENYHTSGEPDKSKRAQDLQRTVAERTSLFLSERRQQYGKGELKHDPDWIQKHLQVYEVRSIELVRTLKSPQGLKKHVAVASACAKTAPNGDIALYVSQTIEADYYEIAVAMCKLLLSKLRPNDALLLLTILQTTLKNLKRRGFNVDRIITARKAEREAAEQRAREERLQAQLKAQSALPEKELASALQKLSSMFPDADTDFLRTLLQTQDPPHLDNAVNQLLASPQYPKKRPQASSVDGPPPYSQAVSAQGHQQPSQAQSGGLFSSLRRQFGKAGETRSASPLPPPPSLSPPPTSPQPQAVSQCPPGMTPQPQRPGATPTSTDAIRANLTRAIQASRPETASNVSNAVDKTEVKESEAYCDATAAANLSFVAEVGGMRFFASREVPVPTTFVAEHHDALLRFVTQVIRPVGEVFRLDPRALHVFHDLEGPLIAFNRNGSLYLNFRFYQSWHDKLVANGDLAEPLISTFHTIAHELSHNLVKPHDSQFSFYFSAMCEEHFLSMAKLLQTVASAV